MSVDTIVALSSGRPPAALAVIRTSGPRSFDLARAMAGRIPTGRQASLRHFRDPATGEIIDQGLLLCFHGPSTATGEDLVEYHLHGSAAVVARFLESATVFEGVRLAEAGEFTRRALANGRLDLVEADGLADLLAAETEVQRRAAQSRAGGSVSARLEVWRVRMLDLAAMAEIAIDYADEEDGADAPDLRLSISKLADDIEQEIGGPSIDQLRTGIRIVIAGPTNAGKSSLINVLSKSDRSIVTPIAGTTRDVIEVPLSIAGIPVVLVDTAGIRDSEDPVEQLGIDRAKSELGKADLIVWMGEGDESALLGQDERIIRIQSKIDIEPPQPGRIGVSSVAERGIGDLVSLLAARIERLTPSSSQLSLTRREASVLGGAVDALRRAKASKDAVIVAEELRVSRHAIDSVTGRAGVEDVLDALFARFCVGK